MNKFTISKEDLSEVMERNRHNRTHAAKELMISANTLRKYVREYGIGPHTIDLRKPFPVQEAIRLYAYGSTLTALGKLYSVDNTQVRGAFIRHLGKEAYLELKEEAKKNRGNNDR